MTKIEELQTRRQSLAVQVRQVDAEIHAEALRITENTFGVREGSIVRNWHDKSECRVVRVIPRTSDIDGTEFSKPWLIVAPKRKNGEFGLATRTLYAGDWELPA